MINLVRPRYQKQIIDKINTKAPHIITAFKLRDAGNRGGFQQTYRIEAKNYTIDTTLTYGYRECMDFALTVRWNMSGTAHVEHATAFARDMYYKMARMYANAR